MNPQAPMPPTPLSTPPPDPLRPTSLPPATPQPPLQTPLPAKPKTPRHVPAGVIIVVVMVVILLAAGLVYLFNANNKVKAPTTTTPSTTTTPNQPVRPADVDQTSQQLDNDIEALNQTNDASSQDLSDTSLGL